MIPIEDLGSWSRASIARKIGRPDAIKRIKWIPGVRPISFARLLTVGAAMGTPAFFSRLLTVQADLFCRQMITNYPHAQCRRNSRALPESMSGLGTREKLSARNPRRSPGRQQVKTDQNERMGPARENRAPLKLWCAISPLGGSPGHGGARSYHDFTREVVTRSPLHPSYHDCPEKKRLHACFLSLFPNSHKNRRSRVKILGRLRELLGNPRHSRK